ncbi:hypothetical protein GGI12_001612 [Dipsacomyces acuminosporus]|nr:hypothetical protein GGI12_001612 [Dipsacomyces acuminosporus]
MAALYFDNKPNVNIRFNYIGVANSTSKYGVSCPHGDIECFANIQQLCVQKNTSQEEALQFILCQNREFRQVGSYSLFARCIPSPAKMIQTARCALGSEGRQLLLESVKFSEQSKAQVSLTFYLNGSKRCVFDSGQWSRSEDACPGGASVSKFTNSVKELIKKSH